MRNILVVDNLLEERKSMISFIKSFGLNIIGIAENGLEAYEKYEELQPDLVTMNINMPVMDGLSSVKKITAKYPNAKILIASYNSDYMIICESIEHGACDYFLKTDSSEILKEKLFRVLDINV